MGLLINLSLRNLFRQKRRNALLGIAIAIGIMILVTANSFSKGISDVLFNKIVTYVSGHITIDFHEKGGTQTQIFRDKERIDKIVKEIIPAEDMESMEESIGVFTRAVGNGRSDNVVIVGLDFETNRNLTPEREKEFQDSFTIVEGSWDAMKREDVPNPGIVPVDKAEELNVKVGDTVKARFQNVFGQWQAATITVVGIVQTGNMFMDMVIFIDKNNLKDLMAYRSYETGVIQINLTNPKKAKMYADKLHEVLNPGVAVELGNVNTLVPNSESLDKITVLGFKSGDENIDYIKQNMKLISGAMENVTKKGGVAVSKFIADKLGLKVGNEFTYTYANKFEDKDTVVKYKVDGIFDSKGFVDEHVILMNEERLYDTYFNDLPESIEKYSDAYVPDESDPLYEHIAKEWTLLERSQTTDDLERKMKEIAKKKWKGVTVDVNSMYESASDILKLESALNLITLLAVMVLFFIILVGVINTLRMTIRERTREIGTTRAIGMKKADVRNMFILETFFLTLFSSIAGVVLAFILMFLLSKITFDVTGNPLGMLLVKKRLHFMPTFNGIVMNVLFIHIIAVVTAFFPARKAANLSPADALRHYE